MLNHTPSKLLAIVTGMAIAMSVCANPLSTRVPGNSPPGAAGNQALVALAQRPAALRRGDLVTGLLPVKQPMHLVIALKLRNRAQLDRFLANAQQKGTAVAQRSMSAGDFVAQFAPTRAQAQVVVDYLTKAGFTNIEIAPNRQLVSGDATADTVRAAFHVGLVQVRTHDGRLAYASTSTVMVPATLRDSVLSVLGLQTVNAFHTSVQATSSHNVTQSSSVPGFSGYDPTDFASFYGASGAPTAATVPVGIISEGSMTSVLSDLNMFTTSHHLPAVTTQVVGKGSSDTSGDVEWDLDSQDIVGMSGGVKKLIFYASPTFYNSDITADINTAVSANAAKIINVSLNECERDAEADGMLAATDQILKQAAAQGQTFSVSSGDKGSNECDGTAPAATVSYPASSPYVISVGGTWLGDTTGTDYPGETFWGDGGGGVSEFEPMPSWQVGVGQNLNSTNRGIPDVAFDANPATGAVITYHGQLAQYGGTSLSAPLFAGAWARILASKGIDFGFAAPLLYEIDPKAFNDVTFGADVNYSAYPGWDYTTGFGSLDVGRTIQGFNTPIANFTLSTNTNLTVGFIDTSTDWGGTLSQHIWDFGDGSTSSAANPVHTYAAQRSYYVIETVVDSKSGNSSTKAMWIYAKPSPPAANFTYQTLSDVPGGVYFYDYSQDPGKSLGDDSIEWIFGDGSHGESPALGSSIYHQYAAGGTYFVTEVVTNSFTGSGSITKSLIIPPVTAPVLGLPASSGGGYTVSWTAVTSASHYVLQQQFSGGSWVTVQDSASLSWFSITTLGPHASGDYNYRVQACNDGGCGSFSPVATIAVTLGTAFPPPATAPVLNLPATSSSGNYSVTWSAVTGATGYTLQALGASGRWVGLGHVFSNALAVSGKPSGTYQYRARGCNAFGCGPWSDVGTITVSLP